jgi:AcrR family transcriptional regulator
MGSEVSTGGGRPARGRIERRQAILDGAFAVFTRHGYAQACVKEIAQEAGVAKPTVYSHLNDKESLYREAVELIIISTNKMKIKLSKLLLSSSICPRREEILESCCDPLTHRLTRI